MPAPALPVPPAPEVVVVLAPPDPTVVVVTVVPTVDVEPDPIVTLDVVDEPVVMSPVEVVEAAVVLDEVLEPAVERPPSAPGRTPSIMRPPHSNDAANATKTSGLPKPLSLIRSVCGCRPMHARTAQRPLSFCATQSARPHLETDLLTLKNRLKEHNDLESAASLLRWDQATYMPAGGAAARGRQLATLDRLAHDCIADPEIGRLLDRIDEKLSQTDEAPSATT